MIHYHPSLPHFIMIEASDPAFSRLLNNPQTGDRLTVDGGITLTVKRTKDGGVDFVERPGPLNIHEYQKLLRNHVGHTIYKISLVN